MALLDDFDAKILTYNETKYAKEVYVTLVVDGAHCEGCSRLLF